MDNSNGEGVPNVVIASNRFHELKTLVKFFSDWRYDFEGVHVIVIGDYPRMDSEVRKNILEYADEVYDWRDIDKELGDKAWIIPRRTSAIKSFGFYKAWKNKASFIVTLDDDTRPEIPGEHFKKFYDLLFNGEKTPETRWMSTLTNRMLPRGTPKCFTLYDVAHGGWIGVPDLNAKEEVQRIRKSTVEDFYNGPVPRGVKISLCGMNLAWRPEMTKHLYFGLQGHMMKDGELVKLPYDRFDDIWAGLWLVSENVASIHTGEPFVIHDKASNVWSNIRKEEPGLRDQCLFEEFIIGMRTDNEYFDKTLKDAYAVWYSLFEVKA